MGDNCSPMSTRKQYHLFSTTHAAQSHKGLIPGCEEGAILWIYQGELRQYDHMGISKSYQGNQTLSDLWDTPDQGKGRTSSHLGLIKWYTFNTAVVTHQPSIWYLMCAWRTHRTVPGASAQLSPNVNAFYSTAACLSPCSSCAFGHEPTISCSNMVLHSLLFSWPHLWSQPWLPFRLISNSNSFLAIDSTSYILL